MHAAATAAFRAVSPPRVAGWSTALALHAVALALVVIPPQALFELRPKPAPDMEAVIVREVVPRTEPVPPPPQPPQRRTAPRATPVVPVVPVQLAESALPVPVAVAPLTPTLEPTGEPSAPAATQGAQIAYDHAPPPPYPPLARRRGWEGDVLLRVRVAADGRPREVVVERSSGRSLLDRAASEHVLAKWRFQPALHEGRQVDAWARVPISFKIERY
jgi:protein TonB